MLAKLKFTREQLEHMTPQAKIDSITPAITDVIAASHLPGASFVSLRDDLLAILDVAGLSYKQSMHCSSVGVHPRNRGGTGVAPDRVHAKVMMLAKIGFSFRECGNACATERPKSEEVTSTYILFNDKLGASSPYLANVVADTLNVFTITASHTNQALRAIYYGVPCDDPNIADDGHLSVRKIGHDDPRITDVLRDGMPMTIIRAAAEAAFPDIIDIISRADNVPHHAASVDSPIMLMKGAHALAAQQAALNNGVIDWERIIDEVTLGAPGTVGISDLIDFVKHWSGGTDKPWALDELDLCLRGLNVVRDIEPKVYGKIGTVVVGNSIGAIRFRLAVIKANASAPSKYCSSGTSRFIAASDICSFSGRLKPFILNIETMMVEARTLVVKLRACSPRSDQFWAMHLDRFDVMLIAHVINRPHAYTTFSSLALIGNHFKEMLVTDGINIDGVTFPKDWKSAKAAPKPSSDAQPKLAPRVDGITSLPSDGALTITDLTNMMAQHGVVVGQNMMHKSSRASVMIKAITPNGVIVKEKDKKQFVVIFKDANAELSKIESQSTDCNL
jgi:hypothetical protein